MEVVGHHHESVRFDIRLQQYSPLPFLCDDLAKSGKMHYGVDHTPKQARLVGGADDDGEQVTLPPIQHVRQDSARGVEMRINVDIPDSPPIGVCHIHATGNEDSRVRAKQVEPAVSVHGLPYKLDDLALDSDIGPDRQTAYLAGDLGSAIGVRIGNDDTSRALGSESPGKGAPNAMRAAGHDGHFIVEIHAPIRTPKQADPSVPLDRSSYVSSFDRWPGSACTFGYPATRPATA